MSTKKGYSLIVLIIAIAVILILSSVSITMLQTSRETIASADFIYDITTVEEMIKQYYAESGTLPTISDNPILNNAIPAGMKSQLDLLDNENYYEVDLGKIGNISIRDREREYIVNEQTLKVYCRNPLVYKEENYYTVTDELMGVESHYKEQNEEFTIVGNPVVWSERGRLRLVVPRKALGARDEGEPAAEFWSNWTFRWDFGPKSIDDIKTSSTARSFSYGDTLVVKTNGVYTIYVKDATGTETVLNVVVTKVDDIKPQYTLDVTTIDIIDNETGIKGIYYRTRAEYNENKAYAESIGEGEAQGRNELDFYLIKGKGSNLITDMPLDVQDYNARYTSIVERRNNENRRFNDLTAEEQANNLLEHESFINELAQAETALKEQYPYLADIHAATEKGHLVLFVEDNAGNAVVIGEDSEAVSFNMLTHKYNLGTVVTGI